MNWPRSSEREIRVPVHLDLTDALERLKVTIANKLRKMGDLTYEYDMEIF